MKAIPAVVETGRSAKEELSEEISGGFWVEQIGTQEPDLASSVLSGVRSSLIFNCIHLGGTGDSAHSPGGGI